MASPHPTPTAQKEITGSWRAKANKAEPRPEVNLPKPPPHVKGEALKEYNRVGKLLLGQCVVTDLDRGILTLYAMSWGEIVEAEQKIEEFGKVQSTSTGYTQPSGWVTLRNQAMERTYKYALQLGITPSARTRIQAIDTGGDTDEGFEAPKSTPPPDGKAA